MKHIAISTIDELYKGQVKGYTRTRKGKMERVKSYQSDRASKMAHLLSGKSEEKIKTIGSQKRESLATTDFELVGKKGKEIILRDKESGIHELWVRNDSHAGYTIDIGGKGYEFVREVKDVSKLESMGVKIGEPFSATPKQMEHEIHRMSTMEHKALVTRANKIGSPEKLQRFFAVAEKLQRPALQAEIVKIGREKFGLKNEDFEPLSSWEKKKSPKRIIDKGMQDEKSLQKGEVKPFSRTRRGRFERVKGHHRDQPFGNKDIVGVIKEGRIADVAFKPSELPKKGKGEVVPIRGSKLIDDIKAGTSPYQKMSMAENYLIDIGGYGPRGEPYSTKGTQIQKIGGVDIKKIIQSAYPSYKGRKVSIGTNIPSELHSWWDEGNRSYYTFYELATGRMQGTGSNHPMFEAKQPRYLSSLPSGVVIVERNYSGPNQNIHIYANEGDLTATSHFPAGALDQAIKNFTSSKAPTKPEQEYLPGQKHKGPFDEEWTKKQIEMATNPGSPYSTKESKRMIRPSTPEEHKIKIAEDTLKMPDAMAGVMGPTKEEATRILEEKYKKGEYISPEILKEHTELTNIFMKPKAFSTKERIGPRSVYMIAQEIVKDWKNVNYGAKPYLDAMHALETIETPYGADSGASIIAYFLANAQTWKGETAKRVKKELNAMLKTYYKKSMEDEVLDKLVKAESRVKSHWRSIKGKMVNVREHQRYKLRGMLNHIRYSKEAGESRGVTLRSLQDRFGLSTEMAHRVHRLAEALGSSLFKPFPVK